MTAWSSIRFAALLKPYVYTSGQGHDVIGIGIEESTGRMTHTDLRDWRKETMPRRRTDSPLKA